MLQVIQHGYLAATPELRYTPEHGAVATMAVITTDRWTDKETGEEREIPTKVYWECWGKSAENLAKILQKGSQVLVRGTIRNSSWEKDGVMHYRDKHVVNYWRNLDRKSGEQEQDGHGEDVPSGVDPEVIG